MNTPALYIVDVMGEVVANTATALKADSNSWLSQNGKDILYQYGRSIQILQILQNLTDGISQTTRGSKYPLFALFQDFPETAQPGGYYATVRFPKIVIATLTNLPDPVPKRYDLTFRPILYPIYMEFLNQLTRHRNIVTGDANSIVHTKYDRPGTQPAASKQQSGANFNDYLDVIEIQNLELTFTQKASCKTFK